MALDSKIFQSTNWRHGAPVAPDLNFETSTRLLAGSEAPVAVLVLKLKVEDLEFVGL